MRYGHSFRIAALLTAVTVLAACAAKEEAVIGRHSARDGRLEEA